MYLHARFLLRTRARLRTYIALPALRYFASVFRLLEKASHADLDRHFIGSLLATLCILVLPLNTGRNLQYAWTVQLSFLRFILSYRCNCTAAAFRRTRLVANVNNIARTELIRSSRLREHDQIRTHTSSGTCVP